MLSNVEGEMCGTEVGVRFFVQDFMAKCLEVEVILKESVFLWLEGAEGGGREILGSTRGGGLVVVVVGEGVDGMFK